MCSYPSSNSAIDGSFSSLHQYIIQTHILSRLDGQTLAATACASPELQSLCSDDNLWTHICNTNWPSTDDSLVRETISTFPSGHRSFFSDSFPSPNYRRRRDNSPEVINRTPTSELVSAVDIRYGNDLVFSKVQVTKTAGEWFQTSPIRVDLLDPKEIVPTSVKFESEYELFRSNLETHLTLTWIVIDPNRKRSVNLSSTKPVSVKRHWLTGDLQVRYAIVIPAGPTEHVSCNIDVTCGGSEGGEMKVSEVSMQVRDMEGKSLNGKDSLVIIQEVMESERRKQGQNGDKRKEYEEYLEMKREKKEEKEKRERRLDMVWIASGVTIFVTFCSLIFFT